MRPALFFVSLLALQAQEAPVFRSGIRIVDVPVVAKNAADIPVNDLHKEDLRVFDNGVEQTILSFDRLNGDDVAPGRPPRRLTIIVLDALNTPWGVQIYGRDAVADTLKKLTPGADRIAIFALGDRLHLLHDFSTDLDSLRAVVDGYAGEQPFFGIPEAPNPSAPRDVFAEFAQEQRVSVTLDALRKVASILRNASSEKNVLWVTAGFPPPSAHQPIQAAMRDMAAARVMLYPVDARGVLASVAANINVGTMQELAEQTGGRVFYNDNDTASLVRAALEDSREGYVLTYSPRDSDSVTTTHIVELKTSRKGVTLRYRPGY